jgi:hypothetical protein
MYGCCPCEIGDTVELPEETREMLKLCSDTMPSKNMRVYDIRFIMEAKDNKSYFEVKLADDESFEKPHIYSWHGTDILGKEVKIIKYKE